jgi:DNA-binding response OmpR family regulator
MSEPTILIADDNPDVRSMLRAFFSDYACELVEATDGEQAIEALIVEQPDLVILDVMMPEVNGWEVCRYIKERDDLSFMKVIMLTGIGHNLNSMTSPLYGADAYLDKPFDLDALEETLKELLGEEGIQRKS